MRYLILAALMAATQAHAADCRKRYSVMAFEPAAYVIFNGGKGFWRESLWSRCVASFDVEEDAMRAMGGDMKTNKAAKMWSVVDRVEEMTIARAGDLRPVFGK